MPRKARITVPGAVHHIMSRGIEGRPIFSDDSDRNLFLNILKKRLLQAGYLLYAWSLMPNHYHLVLRINNYPLGVFMRLFNGQYAQYIRKKEGKRGHLFQDRYKSIVTQDQNYVEELIRYVHLNPLRSDICKNISDLDRYPWCGHSVIMGNNQYPPHNTQDVLKRFGKDKKSQHMKYRQFIKKGLEKEPDIYERFRDSNTEKENIHNTGCWVIGNKEFLKKVLNEKKQKTDFIPHYLKKDIGIEDITRQICDTLGIKLESVRIRGRQTVSSRARKLISFAAHRIYEIPVVHIARYFKIRPQSVSQLIKQGELLIKDYKLNL